VARGLFCFATGNGGTDVELVEYEGRAAGLCSVWFDFPASALDVLRVYAADIGVEVRDHRRRAA
jgi:hypothetical protein